MIRSISSCYRGEVAYNQQVRLIWNFRWLALVAALPLLVAGCGGVSASQTVSPASFFLPGIMKAAPPSAECTNLFAISR